MANNQFLLIFDQQIFFIIFLCYFAMAWAIAKIYTDTKLFYVYATNLNTNIKCVSFMKKDIREILYDINIPYIHTMSGVYFIIRFIHFNFRVFSGPTK